MSTRVTYNTCDSSDRCDINDIRDSSDSSDSSDCVEQKNCTDNYLLIKDDIEENLVSMVFSLKKKVVATTF